MKKTNHCQHNQTHHYAKHPTKTIQRQSLKTHINSQKSNTSQNPSIPSIMKKRTNQKAHEAPQNSNYFPI
jgi:hypothetical protein